jgi:threonine dehydratase
MDFFAADPQDWEISKNEVNLTEIEQAAARIRDIVPVTPVVKSIYHSQKHKLNIWYKLENFNVTGSFKIRGASNALKIAAPMQLAHGVIAASAGNHAQGVAYVSKLMGLRSIIFMPERTPINKVEATRGHGAEIRLVGAVYDDSFAEAIKFQESTGGFLIHAFSDTAVINGQGTVGLEIFDQIPDVGLVLVPVGGGGLASGLACAIKSKKPDVMVIGVQTEAFPSMKLALETKSANAVPAGMTIADGIAVKRPSPRTLSLALHYVDQIITVSESETAAAVMSLMEKDHTLAEGAGAVGVAAVQKLSPEVLAKVGGRPICCVISGGNIDVSLLGRIATQGLIASGRMMHLRMRTKDQPGQLAEILKALSQTGANLLEVRHHRHFGAMYYSDVDIELELETSDFDHQAIIRKKLLDFRSAK